MLETTIVLDAASAEKGVDEIMLGAALGLRKLKRPIDLHLVVYDDSDTQSPAGNELASAASAVGASVTFHTASDRLPDSIESPVKAYRSYANNPINIAFQLYKKTGGAIISPGNTGLVMTCALFELGRIPGISRPPIATPWPTRRKSMFILDSGANVDVRPVHLHQFAHIGRVYMSRVFKRENPRIGLLSNGSEDYKGSQLVKEAHKLLSEDSAINFVGHVEGQSLLDGNVDVLLCDGFLGNILLKFAEGLASTFGTLLKEEITRNPFTAMAAWLFFRGSMARFKRRFDYSEWGGAPLLGVKGNVVICHGRSEAKAIMNSILWASRMVDEDVSRNIEAEVRRANVLAENGPEPTQ
jgi:glycerol-3-phosphate acyltransferase PlsX